MELMKIEVNSNQEQIVSARELHKTLEVGTEFRKWFPRMAEYGFQENSDFVRVYQKCPTPGGEQEKVDYHIKLDMAKEIAMIQRSEKGKQIRQYLIQVEKDWNSPEKTMARALVLADKTIHELTTKIELDKPKTLFADAVSASRTSILIGDLAKLIKQNGVDIGQKRMFDWMRDNGYLIKRQGADYNSPTQRSMELGLMEIKEGSHVHSDGHVSITKTSKITGKGQQYFINKFLGKKEVATWN